MLVDEKITLSCSSILPYFHPSGEGTSYELANDRKNREKNLQSSNF